MLVFLLSATLPEARRPGRRPSVPGSDEAPAGKPGLQGNAGELRDERGARGLPLPAPARGRGRASCLHGAPHTRNGSERCPIYLCRRRRQTKLALARTWSGGEGKRRSPEPGSPWRLKPRPSRAIGPAGPHDPGALASARVGALGPKMAARPRGLTLVCHFRTGEKGGPHSQWGRGAGPLLDRRSGCPMVAACRSACELTSRRVAECRQAGPRRPSQCDGWGGVGRSISCR